MAKAKPSNETEIKEETTKKAAKINWVTSVGRRKRAVARARIWLEKNGQILVNDKPVEEYFPALDAKVLYEEPLKAVDRFGQMSVSVKVSGGGPAGQLGATVHALSNALVKFDESLREPLAKKGLLTRDPREKERRKYGYAGKARARKQSPKR